MLPPFSRLFFTGSVLYAGNDDIPESWGSSKFGQIRLLIAELAALERLKKDPIDL